MKEWFCVKAKCDNDSTVFCIMAKQKYQDIECIWLEKKPPRNYSIIDYSFSFKLFGLTNELLTNKLGSYKQTNKVLSKLHFGKQSWKWLIGLWGRP